MLPGARAAPGRRVEAAGGFFQSSLLSIPTETCGIEPVALTDMGDGIWYRCQPSGLYPGGSNTIPDEDAADAPAITGRFGFMSLGVSNTAEHWRAFEARAGQNKPNMVLIAGARRGPDNSEAPQVAAAPREILERETGLEPATPSLGSSCSTN
jgi:hypothetical protein